MIFTTLLVTAVLGQGELPVTDVRRRQRIVTSNNRDSSFAVNNVGAKGPGEVTDIETIGNINSHFVKHNAPYIQNGGGRHNVNPNNPHVNNHVHNGHQPPINNGNMGNMNGWMFPPMGGIFGRRRRFERLSRQGWNQLVFERLARQMPNRNPGMNNPGMNNPGMNNPGANRNPGMNNPGMSNPGMNNPGMSNPGMNNPGMSNPGMNNPGMNNPGMNNPGVNRNPGMTNPGVNRNPGMTNPGVNRNPGVNNNPGVNRNPGANNPGNNMRPGSPWTTSINADRNKQSNVAIDNSPFGFPGDVGIDVNDNFFSDVGIKNTGFGNIGTNGNEGSTIRINNGGRRLGDSSEGDELEVPETDPTL